MSTIVLSAGVQNPMSATFNTNITILNPTNAAGQQAQVETFDWGRPGPDCAAFATDQNLARTLLTSGATGRQFTDTAKHPRGHMNEFLNPKSMATPGAAGGITMFFANALCNTFPVIPFRYTCLFLSFFIGGIIHSTSKLDIPSRVGFFLLNSLVIFAMGVGTSNIGANIVQTSQADRPLSLQGKAPISAVESLFINSAIAHTQSTDAETEKQNERRQHRSEGRAQNNRSNSSGGSEGDTPRSDNGQGDSTRSGFFNRW